MGSVVVGHLGAGHYIPAHYGADVDVCGIGLYGFHRRVGPGFVHVQPIVVIGVATDEGQTCNAVVGNRDIAEFHRAGIRDDVSKHRRAAYRNDRAATRCVGIDIRGDYQDSAANGRRAEISTEFILVGKQIFRGFIGSTCESSLNHRDDLRLGVGV